MSFDAWIAGLEERHTKGLTFQEIRKGVQALSRVYVQKRSRIEAGAALDGRGKRAAFALLYGPLHFRMVREVVEALELNRPAPAHILDLGCGTGAGGAGWGSACEPAPEVLGLDINNWAIGEARKTYRAFGLAGRTKRGRAERFALPKTKGGIVCAYTANELDDAGRALLLERLLEARAGGSRVLVIEPIAKSAAPWWPAWAERFVAAGGRDDAWQLEPRLPEQLVELDRAAGLDHTVVKTRTLSL